MLDYLADAGHELHLEFVKMYWILLAPLLIFQIAFDLFISENPNIRDVLRRLLISVLLLCSFDWTINTLATLGDAITDHIQGLQKLSDVLKSLGPTNTGNDSMFNLRATILYVFSLAAYLIALVGFFTATVLTQFVWTILYVCSPLMILAYVSPHTSGVTKSLYKGVTNVVLWKILWSILGVLLLKLALQPEVSGFESSIMSIVMNLCIGVCMLFIPLATKSLLTDGLGSMANTFAMAPAIATAGAVKMSTQHLASKGMGHIKSAGSFVGSPLKNQFGGRMEQFGDWAKPATDKVQNWKKRYESFGTPDYIRNKREKENKSN